MMPSFLQLTREHKNNDRHKHASFLQWGTHLTGGGMTLALSHIVLLRDLLRPQLKDTSSFANIPSPSTPWQVAPPMNTLAGALYKVFRASPDHAARNEMCQACFDYMSPELGSPFLCSGYLWWWPPKASLKSSLHYAFPLMWVGPSWLSRYQASHKLKTTGSTLDFSPFISNLIIRSF
ncbi:PREDICTED: uncharacterized protein LOC105107837 [Populus euphratica]|uniref:Squalene monooxygenase n=1 Tax=Populus euphratica TaxID=75702 RepID=A0AAJ6SWC2_POPEU|nr:PREDICTED: uncharacterized protein LOC105107837 [Populus euphratica]